MRLIYFPKFGMVALIDEMDRARAFAANKGKPVGGARAERLALTFDSPSFDGETLTIDTVGYIELLAFLYSKEGANPQKVRSRIYSLFPGEPFLEEMRRAAVRAGLPVAGQGGGEAAYFTKRAQIQMSDAMLDGWRLDEPTAIVTVYKER